MTAGLREQPSLARPCAAIGDTPAILASICDPAVQLALWQRARSASLSWIDTLNWDEIDDIDIDIDIGIAGPDWAQKVAPLLREAGYPQSAAGDALATELVERAATFAALMGCERLNMRLEVIETDACRKFHMDHVRARLLMPLYGPGTQWIESTFGSNAPINQLSIGHVGIFKGRQAVDEPAILHRSPPVAATGETRLLLAITALNRNQED